MNTQIIFHFEEIPEETRRAIGLAASDLALRILRSPGGREALEKEKAEMAAERRSKKAIETVDNKK